jgi:hypothetical protein
MAIQRLAEPLGRLQELHGTQSEARGVILRRAAEMIVERRSGLGEAAGREVGFCVVNDGG